LEQQQQIVEKFSWEVQCGATYDGGLIYLNDIVMCLLNTCFFKTVSPKDSKFVEAVMKDIDHSSKAWYKLPIRNRALQLSTTKAWVSTTMRHGWEQAIELFTEILETIPERERVLNFMNSKISETVQCSNCGKIKICSVNKSQLVINSQKLACAKDMGEGVGVQSLVCTSGCANCPKLNKCAGCGDAHTCERCLALLKVKTCNYCATGCYQFCPAKHSQSVTKYAPKLIVQNLSAPATAAALATHPEKLFVFNEVYFLKGFTARDATSCFSVLLSYNSLNEITGALRVCAIKVSVLSQVELKTLLKSAQLGFYEAV
jgi:hypothetical protein